MHNSGLLPLTFEGPEQGLLGVKNAKMGVGKTWSMILYMLSSFACRNKDL